MTANRKQVSVANNLSRTLQYGYGHATDSLSSQDQLDFNGAWQSGCLKFFVRADMNYGKGQCFGNMKIGWC